MPTPLFYEYAAKRAEDEATRKSDLFQRGAVAAAILAFSGNVAAGMCIEYVPGAFRWWHLFSMVVLLAGVVVSLRGAKDIFQFFFLASYYAQMPPPDPVQAWVNSSLAKGMTVEKVDEALKQNLSEKASKAASHNYALNTRRNNALMKGFRHAIAGLVIVLIAAALYLPVHYDIHSHSNNKEELHEGTR
jgi:hypothetical protein